MIIYIPVGGLANRMRMIDSSLRLSKKINAKYKIYWIKDAGLNCSFGKIWNPIVGVQDVQDLKKTDLLFKLRRKFLLIRKGLNILERLNLLKVISDQEFQGYFDLQYDFEDLKKYKWVIIRSCSAFFPSSSRTEYEEFVLNDNIKQILTDEIRKFPSQTIGIHIRRTDNFDAILGSPLDSFIQLMNGLLQDNQNTFFYVASDDSEVKNKMKNHFLDHVILPQGVLTRDSEAGIIQAIVEMYALAETSKIYGSYYSSYSELAAAIGKKNLIIVS